MVFNKNKLRLLFLLSLITTTFSCTNDYNKESNKTITLNSIGLEVSFELPASFDTTFNSVYFSDHDCQNTKSHSFANKGFNTIYLDTLHFFDSLGDSGKIKYELLEVSEELKPKCANKDYQSFLDYVKQINGLYSFDSSQYHNKVTLIENDDRNIIQLISRSKLKNSEFWIMQLYVHANDVYFEITLYDSKNKLNIIESIGEKIIGSIKIKKRPNNKINLRINKIKMLKTNRFISPQFTNTPASTSFSLFLTSKARHALLRRKTGRTMHNADYE